MQYKCIPRIFYKLETFDIVEQIEFAHFGIQTSSTTNTWTFQYSVKYFVESHTVHQLIRPHFKIDYFFSISKQGLEEGSVLTSDRDSKFEFIYQDKIKKEIRSVIIVSLNFIHETPFNCFYQMKRTGAEEGIKMLTEGIVEAILW